jgi:hypothetical protein
VFGLVKNLRTSLEPTELLRIRASMNLLSQIHIGQ